MPALKAYWYEGLKPGAKEGAKGNLRAAKGENRNFPALLFELQKQYPGNEAAAVAAEVNKIRPKRGMLELLRNGFSLAGVGKIELVTFKPATGFNPGRPRASPPTAGAVGGDAL